MTTLIYRPVLIESAEQAEALPIGTVVQRIMPVDVGKPEPYSGVKFASNTWFTTSTTLDLRDALDRHMVGWTALVPIEAEETRDEGTGWIVPTAFGPKLMGAYLGSPDDTPAKRYTQTIWRTPWTPTEEA